MSLSRSIAALADLTARPPHNVGDYGARGGGLGTTVAATGGDITALRTETGQAWLQSTDSWDLIAYYRALARADTDGRGIVFPKDDYVFTGPGYVHSDVTVDLGGSTVTNTQTDDSRFVRAGNCFLLGILARADFARFSAQGWHQTADDLAIDAIQITTLSGTAPSIGDTLLIRTTALTGDLPDYTTFNEVIGVAGTTVTLRWPIEKAITAPIVVNYSTITTLKSALVAIGDPHRYYCAKRASLVNGTLVSQDGTAWHHQAALDCDVDVRVRAPLGESGLGNGLNRSRVRIAGVFGGDRSAIELGVGSALSVVDLDIRYSGDESGGSAGTYPLVQIGEFAEQVVMRGRIDAGDKAATIALTLPQAHRCTVDLEMVARGVTAQGIAMTSSSVGARVRGRYTFGSPTYYARWTNGASDCWLDGATFGGAPSSAALAFEGPDGGGARGVVAPSGQLLMASGASGNVVIDSYVAAGLHNNGPQGSRIAIKTSEGSWPEDDIVTARTANGSESVPRCYGRTITNTGAGAIVTRTLAASAAGMTIRAYRDSATHALRIAPATGETIGTGGAGKYLSLDADKAWVELRCLVAGHWVVAASAGTIGFEA